MKNRDYKIFAPSNYYHVYNRGTGRINIFKDLEDYSFFLKKLGENLYPTSPAEDRPEHGRYISRFLPASVFDLTCYCLMPNYFHFLIRQNSEVTISKLITRICTSFAIYFNKKYERFGHLFESKFKSILVEQDSQLLWLSAYIHTNPLVAKIVDDLKEYPWSSYLDYIGLRNGTLCNHDIIFGTLGGGRQEYEHFVEESIVTTQNRKGLERLLLDN